MKKLLTILFISLSLAGFCQYPITQNLGSASTLLQVPANGGLRAGLITISFADTIAANLTNIKFYDGAIIKTTSPIVAMWYRNLATTQWIQILPSGSGGLTAWLVNGNSFFNQANGNEIFGSTISKHGIDFRTNNTTRFILDSIGILDNSGAGVKFLGVDTSVSGGRHLVYAPTPTSTNIYNTDGTLAGDRLVDGDSHPLGFSNLAGFAVSTSTNLSLHSSDSIELNATQYRIDNIPTGSANDSIVTWNQQAQKLHKRSLSSIVSGSSWGLLGNSGTNSSTNFLGTTDNVDLIIQRNNLQAGAFAFNSTLGVTEFQANSIVSLYARHQSLRIDNGVAPTTQYGTFNPSTLTGIRSWILPNANGTIALTSDIPAAQTWQQTLDNGSVLNKDNSINGGNHEFDFTNFSVAQLVANNYINLSSTHTQLLIRPDSIYIVSNGKLTINDLANNVGTKAVRYNPTTGLVSYADTTSAGTVSAPNTEIVYGTGSGVTSNADFYNDPEFNSSKGKFSVGFNSFDALNILGVDEPNANSYKVIIDKLNQITTIDTDTHDGKFGINTSSPSVALDVVGNFQSIASTNQILLQNDNLFLGDYNTDIFSGMAFDRVAKTAEISVDGDSKNIILSTTGVQFGGYGAGAATFDASGNITSVSDERMKRNIRQSKTGLLQILNLNPITFQYNKLSGLEMDSTYSGFSAQNVKSWIPYGTGTNKAGYYSLQTTAILGAVVNGEKDLYKMITDLQQQLDKKIKDIEALKKQVASLSKNKK